MKVILTSNKLAPVPPHKPRNPSSRFIFMIVSNKPFSLFLFFLAISASSVPSTPWTIRRFATHRGFVSKTLITPATVDAVFERITKMFKIRISN